MVYRKIGNFAQKDSQGKAVKANGVEVYSSHNESQKSVTLQMTLFGGSIVNSQQAENWLPGEVVWRKDLIPTSCSQGGRLSSCNEHFQNSRERNENIDRSASWIYMQSASLIDHS